MITLRNDFHNTEVRLRAKRGDRLTPSQIRRAWETLCGIPGCTCGGPLGERGPQEVVVQDCGVDQNLERDIRIE